MARDRSRAVWRAPASSAADYPTGTFQSRGGYLGLCNADLSENFIAIFAQPPGSLPFRSKLSDQCRSICAARGCNFLKQHKGVQGYPFETALHFRPPHWFLFLSLIGTSEGVIEALLRAFMVKTGQD